MSLKEQMQTGKVYVEFGHASEEDKAYEQVIEEQRQIAKELCFDYNNTRPMDVKRKDELLSKLLGSRGKSIWMEAPIHFAYGSNTHKGDHVYANFNLTLVDDTHIYVGDHTMIGPNVIIATGGHPVLPELREQGYQYNMPVHIGRNCWIGAGAIILPGVTIGDNTVVGAGSVVTKDLPANVVAVGNPCRILREISDRDREFYYKNRPINLK